MFGYANNLRQGGVGLVRDHLPSVTCEPSSPGPGNGRTLVARTWCIHFLRLGMLSLSLDAQVDVLGYSIVFLKSGIWCSLSSLVLGLSYPGRGTGVLPLP